MIKALTVVAWVCNAVRVICGTLLTAEFIWCALLNFKDHQYFKCFVLLIVAYLISVFTCKKM